MKRISPLFLSLVALGAAAAPAANAATAARERVFHSGPAPVALVELYTSEGCSSCPPAEKWLGALRDDPALWRGFVPVAWHVNYWDHLGWRDALASKAGTARQYAYAETWRDGSVYTPCFARNGAEWRPSGNSSPAADANRARASGATIGGMLTLAWHDGGTAHVSYQPAIPESGQRSAGDRFDVTVALLGGGIVSHVGAGENRGRELRHEFVALRFETVALKRPAHENPGAVDGELVADLEFPRRDDIAAPRHALAAWVTRRGSLVAVQATGGWIE